MSRSEITKIILSLALPLITNATVREITYTEMSEYSESSHDGDVPASASTPTPKPITSKPMPTTVPSQMSMADENGVCRYFCIIMPMTSVPPDVAPPRTISPQPSPIITAPMMHVSIRWSVIFTTPPSSCEGSSVRSASALG